ncbi:hypothetical protein ACM7Q1_14370 [Paenibacillus illinoisensis]|uniref:hypothetical protein n=1 Tax=Paenibacillus illinoisensis TaxID=59845 RepID=UPI003A4DFD0C
MPKLDAFLLGNYALDGWGGDVESEYLSNYSKRVNVTTTGSSQTKMFELGSNKALITLSDRGIITTGSNPSTDINTQLSLTTTDSNGVERLVYAPSELIVRLNNGTSSPSTSIRYVINIYVDMVQKKIGFYWSYSPTSGWAYRAESINTLVSFTSLNLSLYSITNTLSTGGYSEFSSSHVVVNRLK